jgi:DeoR/GlpR family transcriptional regulator of sugar metabolism
LGGERLSTSELWQLYSQNKQTIRELSKRFSVSASTIKRRLRLVREDFECKHFPACGVV